MPQFANPGRFLRLADRLLPWCGAGAAGLFLVGLYLALIGSPADYQQGDSVRIMYVHVPAAWMGLGVYVSMAGAAVVSLVWKHVLADLYARAVAPLGAGFTFLCLATGSLWGKPMWGTWWVWDARMTSVLILLFLYLGYMALVDAFDDPDRGARSGNVLLVIGVVNIPVIKFSVDWWNTLHQPASVLKAGGPSIHPDMLAPLLTMASAYALLFVALALVRVSSAILARRVDALRNRIAAEGGF